MMPKIDKTKLDKTKPFDNMLLELDDKYQQIEDIDKQIICLLADKNLLEQDVELMELYIMHNFNKSKF